jgi:hypothetical protein
MRRRRNERNKEISIDPIQHYPQSPQDRERERPFAVVVVLFELSSLLVGIKSAYDCH